MGVTKEQIERIAILSRLDSDNPQFEKLSQDMDNIIAMVDKLKALDLGESNCVVDTQYKNALRPDEVHESMDRQEILKNASQTEAFGIVVPKVVE